MTRFLASALALVAGAAALALVAGQRAPGAAAAPSAVVIVTATEFNFDPGTIDAQPGEPMTITLTNGGRAPHNIVFELDGGRMPETPPIGGGETATLTFAAPTLEDDYVFYCSIGSHRQEGMEGTLRVMETTGGYEVVASGFLNPHGLALAGDQLLVSEGGTGTQSPGEFVPGDNNGRVSLVDLTNPVSPTVIVDHLTNAVDPGGGVVGANHAVWRAGAAASGTYLVALSGGGGHPDPKGQILSGPAGGPWDVLVDMWDFETVFDPDAGGVDSNPWRIVYGADGNLYLSDAGGNDLIKHDTTTNENTLYALFEPVGMRPDGGPISAVPTGLTFDPRTLGVMYVSLLGSVVDGEAQVRRLEDLNHDGDALDDGENTLLVDELTMAVDVAFHPDGRLFVLEYGGRSAQGRLREAKGAAEPITVSGFKAASAFVFTPEGDALVAAGDPADTTHPAAYSDRVLRVPADMLAPVLPTPTSTPEEPGPVGVIYLPYAHTHQ